MVISGEIETLDWYELVFNSFNSVQAFVISFRICFLSCIVFVRSACLSKQNSLSAKRWKKYKCKTVSYILVKYILFDGWVIIACW